MCSTVARVGAAEVCTEEEWEALLAEVRAEAEVSAWGRFARLFTLEPGELDGSAGGGRPSDEELLARLRDCEALTTQLLAEQSGYLLELRRRRLAAQAGQHPHPEGVCLSACCDPDGWVGLEVAQVTGLSERQVGARIDTALRAQRYARVAGAMQAGRVQAWTATKLLEHLDILAGYVTAQRLAEVEQDTLAWLAAAPRTVGQLNVRLRRIILAAKTAAHPDRPDGDGPDGDGPDGDRPDGDRPDGLGGDGSGCGPVEQQRRVGITPSATPGLAEVVALLPEADAVEIRATLLALGHDPVDPHDPRTAEQRRADLLVTLVTGHPALLGRPADGQARLREAGTLSVHLDVTVPADSLTGAGAPARVPGYGDLAAATARDLAGRAAAAGSCRARPLVYHPDSGHLLGFGPTPVRLTWLPDFPPSRGYTHAPTLDTAIRLRDGTCRAPGCLRPAARCDCDHVVPYPHGPTSLANSCSLCRRHHRLKTHAPGWQLYTDPDGLATWTTPTGHQITTTPTDHRPDPTPTARDDPPPF